MARRVAWLAEGGSDDDPLFASARFGGYIDLGRRPGEQIEGASVHDALAWARARAPVVLIRLWDSDYFSAGERNPNPKRYPDWPEDLVPLPRRPKGLEVLDNTEDDPPVLWDVRLRHGYGRDAAAFRAAIERDPRALPVPAELHDATLSGIRVTVRASTVRQAWSIAEALFDTACASAGPPRLPPDRGPHVAAGYEVYPIAPDAPIMFGGGSTETTPGILSTD